MQLLKELLKGLHYLQVLPLSQDCQAIPTDRINKTERSANQRLFHSSWTTLLQESFFISMFFLTVSSPYILQYSTEMPKTNLYMKTRHF